MNSLVKQARERLQDQGGRMTAQRTLILETLDCLNCHPTADELYAEVRQQDASLSLSTVYRTLRWLEAEGLVSTRRFDEEHRQERFDPASPSEHHHFLCTRCKRVIEFDDNLIDGIKEHFTGQTGCEVESASVTLYGLCTDCMLEGGETRLMRDGA